MGSHGIYNIYILYTWIFQVWKFIAFSPERPSCLSSSWQIANPPVSTPKAALLTWAWPLRLRPTSHLVVYHGKSRSALQQRNCNACICFLDHIDCLHYTIDQSIADSMRWLNLRRSKLRQNLGFPHCSIWFCKVCARSGGGVSPQEFMHDSVVPKRSHQLVFCFGITNPSCLAHRCLI